MWKTLNEAITKFGRRNKIQASSLSITSKMDEKNALVTSHLPYNIFNVFSSLSRSNLNARTIRMKMTWCEVLYHFGHRIMSWKLERFRSVLYDRRSTLLYTRVKPVSKSSFFEIFLSHFNVKLCWRSWSTVIPMFRKRIDRYLCQIVNIKSYRKFCIDMKLDLKLDLEKLDLKIDSKLDGERTN